MKLYQAVKTYGLERVRSAAEGKATKKLKLKTIDKIKEAYRKATRWEKNALFYSAVSIAYFYMFAYPKLIEGAEDHELLPV